jgi:hypothetical protein
MGAGGGGFFGGGSGARASGSVNGSGGGGGSDYPDPASPPPGVSAVTVEHGTRNGDGLITIRYAQITSPDNPQPPPPTQSEPPATAPAHGEPSAAPVLPNSLTLRVLGNRAQLLADKLDVNVVAGCGPVTCDATVTGTIRLPGHGAQRLSSAKAHIAPGADARLRLRTSKALRRAVRRELARHPRRRLAVRVGLTAHGLDATTARIATTVPVRQLTQP